MRATRRTVLLKLAASAVPLAAGVSTMMKKATEYVVRPGETASGISRKTGVPIQNLQKWNNIKDINRIQIGQRLNLAAPQHNVPAVPRTPVPPTVPKPAQPTMRSAFPMANNNPGNMRFYNVGWQGENANGIRRGDFTRFNTPHDGLRAMIRNMRTISKRTGSTTLDKLIPVYSPATENNTAQHIRNISSFSGIRQNQAIDFNNDAQVANLARGLMRAESGKSVSDWFTPQEVLDAVRRSRRSS